VALTHFGATGWLIIAKGNFRHVPFLLEDYNPMIQVSALLTKDVDGDKFVGNILAVDIDGSSMVLFGIHVCLDTSQ
jgi:hypothetical protein